MNNRPALAPVLGRGLAVWLLLTSEEGRHKLRELAVQRSKFIHYGHSLPIVRSGPELLQHLIQPLLAKKAQIAALEFSRAVVVQIDVGYSPAGHRPLLRLKLIRWRNFPRCDVESEELFGQSLGAIYVRADVLRNR